MCIFRAFSGPQQQVSDAIPRVPKFILGPCTFHILYNFWSGSWMGGMGSPLQIQVPLGWGADQNRTVILSPKLGKSGWARTSVIFYWSAGVSLQLRNPALKTKNSSSSAGHLMAVYLHLCARKWLVLLFSYLISSYLYPIFFCVFCCCFSELV